MGLSNSDQASDNFLLRACFLYILNRLNFASKIVCRQNIVNIDIRKHYVFHSPLARARQLEVVPVHSMKIYEEMEV